jgi:hypothetical protein
MKYYSEDDLERALFNLPLEEAPADLRARILHGTIYRHAVPVRAWEAWLIGGSVALLAWLLVLILRDGTTPVIATFNAIAGTVLAVIAQPATILWIAVGGAVAMWMTQLPLTLAPRRVVRD